MNKRLSKYMNEQGQVKRFIAGQDVEEVKKSLQPQTFHDLCQPLPNWHKGYGLATIEKFDDYMFNSFLPQHPALDIYKDSDACDELEIEVVGDGQVEISYFFLMPDGLTEIMIPVKMTGIEKIEEPSTIEERGVVEWSAENAIVEPPTRFVVVSEDIPPEYPITQLDSFIASKS